MFWRSKLLYRVVRVLSCCSATCPTSQLRSSVPSDLFVGWLRFTRPLQVELNFRSVRPLVRLVLVFTTSLLSFSDSYDLQVEWNLRLVRPPGRVKFPIRMTSRSSESPARTTSRSSVFPTRPTSFARGRDRGWQVFRFVRPFGRQTSDSYDLLVGKLSIRTTSWSACFRPVRLLGRQDYRPARPLLFEVVSSSQELVTFLFWVQIDLFKLR